MHVGYGRRIVEGLRFERLPIYFSHLWYAHKPCTACHIPRAFSIMSLVPPASPRDKAQPTATPRRPPTTPPSSTIFTPFNFLLVSGLAYILFQSSEYTFDRYEIYQEGLRYLGLAGLSTGAQVQTQGLYAVCSREGNKVYTSELDEPEVQCVLVNNDTIVGLGHQGQLSFHSRRQAPHGLISCASKRLPDSSSGKDGRFPPDRPSPGLKRFRSVLPPRRRNPDSRTSHNTVFPNRLPLAEPRSSYSALLKSSTQGFTDAHAHVS